MFERLYQKAFTITRHKKAPYAPERERYLEHCAGQGYSSSLLRQISGMLLCIAHEVKDCPDLRVSEEQIQAATQRAIRRPRGFRKIRKVRAFRKTFARETRRWLRFLGRFRESGVKPLPFANLLDDFASWMERERGLSSATIKSRRWHIAVFLHWFGEQGRSISSIRLSDAVAAFLYRFKTITSSWPQTHSTLNAFFRYAITRQYVKASPLPVIVPHVPKYAQPYIYSPNEITALLDSSWALDDHYHRRRAFSVTTFRTLLLLLYGAGLRLGEALSFYLWARGGRKGLPESSQTAHHSIRNLWCCEAACPQDG